MTKTFANANWNVPDTIMDHKEMLVKLKEIHAMIVNLTVELSFEDAEIVFKLADKFKKEIAKIS